MGADALLAGAHKVRGEQPLVERNLGAFEHSANGDGILLAASVALDEAGAVGLAFKALLIVARTTVRANRAVRPMQGFEILASLVGVLEARCKEVRVRHAL
jgi:hypothetical protein